MSLGFPAPAPGPRSLEFLTGGGEMGSLMRSHEWEGTSFGSPHAWPQSLRSALSICLGSSFQIAIYWGPDLALLYNDAWSEIPGDKHPWALGRAGREVWPEIWETIGPMFAQVLSTGEATRSHDQLLPMHRRGFTEECYFDYTFSPIRDEAGSFGGIFNIAVETTFRVIGERRTRLLRDAGEMTSQARSAAEACTLMASALASDPADLPFCLIYLVDPGKPGAVTLAGAAGLPPGTEVSPERLNAADPLSPWPIGEVLGKRESVLVEVLGSRFGMTLPGGPWPEPCERALMVPLPSLGSAESAGALVVGISPRLMLDMEYQSFVDRVASLTAAAIANAHAYEEERRRADALAELDRAKTMFFSNISHEFRTPLTLMMGPVEDILAKPEEQVYPANRELLRVVQRNGLRLQRLVNTLLEFSRIEAGRAQASYEETDLAAFTADLASSFQSAMERAGLRYDIICNPPTQPVYIDREMWEKVVLNLISNAFKYTLKGSVTVRLEERRGQAELSVEDTGTGIPAEELPRLFERFHRVEQSQGRTHEGTGIGLALVQQLVKLHGGEVRVRSTPGQGSTFTVSIPFGSSHLPQDRVGAARRTTPSSAASADVYIEEALGWLPAAAPETEETKAPARVRDRGRVLLADDNADMRDYVRRLLSAEYHVTTAANGQEALESALADPPDLVLSDVMMPVMDGFALLRELHAQPVTRAVPVILLSARAGEEASVEGMEAGADDYLVKPFSARELLARVGAHLALRKERQQTQERLAQIFSQAPVGIAVFRGRDFVIELANPIYQDLMRGRELIGRRLADLGPDVSPDVLSAFRSVMDSGQPFIRNGFHVPYDQDQDGIVEDHWFNVVYHPLEEPSGEVSGIIIVVAEVTGQVRAQHELERANRELEEFAYVASHDLQEPLRMVNLYAQMLLRRTGTDDQSAQDYAGFVRQGVRRMEELIKDLLQYSRVVHPEQDEARPADLQKALDEALGILRARLEESRAEIVVPAPLPKVLGDEAQLALVFQNLVSNALKYQKAGTVPRIQVSAEHNGEVVVRVQDNGIGFDPSHAERIFGLFKRLHKSEYPGTGLGLAICKRIVERYGGRIWAESQGEGCGAVFAMALRGA